jgi:predicted membrane protein
VFGFPDTNVEFKPKNEYQRNQIKPYNKGNDGTDRAVEFVVSTKIGEIKRKNSRSQKV